MSAAEHRAYLIMVGDARHVARQGRPAWNSATKSCTRLMLRSWVGRSWCGRYWRRPQPSCWSVSSFYSGKGRSRGVAFGLARAHPCSRRFRFLHLPNEVAARTKHDSSALHLANHPHRSRPCRRHANIAEPAARSHSRRRQGLIFTVGQHIKQRLHERRPKASRSASAKRARPARGVGQAASRPGAAFVITLHAARHLTAPPARAVVASSPDPKATLKPAYRGAVADGGARGVLRRCIAQQKRGTEAGRARARLAVHSPARARSEYTTSVHRQTSLATCPPSRMVAAADHLLVVTPAPEPVRGP